MVENFDKEVNLLNVLNADENQEIEKENNSNILTKSLIKELDDKWDEIEKNNTNSLSLSQKKYHINNNSMKKNNLINDLKNMIRIKLKNNNLFDSDNSFNNFIKRKKEELKKYKKPSTNNYYDNELTFIKPNKVKENKIYIQPKSYLLLLNNKKSKIQSPEKNNNIIFKNKNTQKKIYELNQNLSNYQNKYKNKKSKTKRFYSITPIKLPSTTRYKKNQYSNKINSIIMPSIPINQSSLNIDYTKNKNLNSLYKLIIN